MTAQRQTTPSAARTVQPAHEFDLRRLKRDIESDVKLLRELYESTESLATSDGKLECLKGLLATKLKGQKVLIFRVHPANRGVAHLLELVSGAIGS